MIAVSVSHLVATYGYLAVFVAVGLESLGVPVPGETTLIAAGIYAGATNRLSIMGIAALAALAAILGDNLGYLLGRTAGQKVLLRLGRHFRLDNRKFTFLQYLFSRHGGKIVFFGRFVTILRTYAALLAGTSKMAWKRFLMFNAAGGVLWAATFGVGSYEFGAVVTRFGNVATAVLGACAVVGAVVGFVAMRRYGSQILARAEAAISASH